MNGLCEKYPNQLCEHICLDEPGSYHCECNPGYTLLPDKKTCRRTEAGGDEIPKFVSTTDRCDENNPCEHHCIDTGVSIRCTCDSGFQLANDKTTCNGKFVIISLEFLQLKVTMNVEGGSLFLSL